MPIVEEKALISRVPGRSEAASQPIQKVIGKRAFALFFVRITARKKQISAQSLSHSFKLLSGLGIPLVFDYHHHLANQGADNWEGAWERVVSTWGDSSLPIKMHISSPRFEKDFRAHRDYIDVEMFLTFLKTIKGSVPEIYCMIEAKKKDEALFQLMRQIKRVPGVELINEASFRMP
ncbi:hypothetical protein [Bacillus canaveralius]|uniref:hypothetical protein n=1 Tax=Bacillus canaveralius TaxID=1403243 RepID=UPI00289E9E6A|nr:hypothetical protein [Bacillus canaveralius]